MSQTLSVLPLDTLKVPSELDTLASESPDELRRITRYHLRLGLVTWATKCIWDERHESVVVLSFVTYMFELTLYPIQPACSDGDQ